MKGTTVGELLALKMGGKRGGEVKLKETWMLEEDELDAIMNSLIANAAKDTPGTVTTSVVSKKSALSDLEFERAALLASFEPHFSVASPDLQPGSLLDEILLDLLKFIWFDIQYQFKITQHRNLSSDATQCLDQAIQKFRTSNLSLGCTLADLLSKPQYLDERDDEDLDDNEDLPLQPAAPSITYELQKFSRESNMVVTKVISTALTVEDKVWISKFLYTHMIDPMFRRIIEILQSTSPTENNIHFFTPIIHKILSKKKLIPMSSFLSAPQIRLMGNYFCSGTAVTGKGAFGILWKGYHLPTGEMVAIKELEPLRELIRLRGGPDAGAAVAQAVETQVVREVEIMQELKGHNNIVRLNDVFLWNGDLNEAKMITSDEDLIRWARIDGWTISLIQEFVPGGDFADYLRKHAPLPEPEIRYWLNQFAEAFKFMRSKEISHRDLKPANILLTASYAEKGVLKLCDFGLSRALKGEQLAETLVGSPIYMAPEIAAASSTGYSSTVDLWSFGLILFQMYSGLGSYPFATAHFMKKAEEEGKQKRAFPPQPRNLGQLLGRLSFGQLVLPGKEHGCSEDMQDLMRRLLRKKDQGRIGWAGFFLHEAVVASHAKKERKHTHDKKKRTKKEHKKKKKKKAHGASEAEAQQIVELNKRVDDLAAENEQLRLKLDHNNVTIANAFRLRVAQQKEIKELQAELAKVKASLKS
eukprot:TRINITY_DN11719_c0_g1_i1.p1 TRINITY_DN11719_c0_g1~~TRINITY_DN11719_c0_g1_i1.p1  ORF type:complete len:700 (-),score=158.88 TRINITY_DN11719_c0_g1_i1:67-2166(-)